MSSSVAETVLIGPITDTVLVVALVTLGIVIVVVAYLIYLARLGRPIDLKFSGYGVNLSIGQTTVVKSSPREKEALLNETD